MHVVLMLPDEKYYLAVFIGAQVALSMGLSIPSQENLNNSYLHNRLVETAEEATRGTLFLFGGSVAATIMAALCSMVIARLLGPELRCSECRHRLCIKLCFSVRAWCIDGILQAFRRLNSIQTYMKTAQRVFQVV